MIPLIPPSLGGMIQPQVRAMVNAQIVPQVQGGSAPFTPASIPGLFSLWLANTTDVLPEEPPDPPPFDAFQWLDSIGSNDLETTLEGSAVYPNSTPGRVEFDGSGRMINDAITPPPSTTFSVFVISKNSATPNNGHMDMGATATNQGPMIFTESGDMTYRVTSGTTITDATDDGTELSIRWITFEHDGVTTGTAKAYRDGSLVNTAAYSGSAPGTFAKVSLGSLIAAVYSFTGEIRAAAIYSSTVSAADIAALQPWAESVMSDEVAPMLFEDDSPWLMEDGSVLYAE